MTANTTPTGTGIELAVDYDADPIEIRDPAAEALGVLDPGDPFVVTYADAVKASGHSCPTTSGAYRIAQLGLDEPFGIVDAGTTVWRADRDRRQPAQTPQTDPPARPVPDFVCVSCGRHATRAAGAGSVTPRGECE